MHNVRCVLCARCAVLWTVRSEAVWSGSVLLQRAQRFQEDRFSETESLRIQYRLVRIYSTVGYN